ncbi:MAG TPA: BadF/BadG/BcrA/BcrD ATPase family protein [Gaiellales bacterium]|jgi:N-acetylglucosamine kinase-like BadF-type ATPase|nr:BadF/BadG/BcrA/BcrD ATPase family protein [Gaiellales bacterium]
MADLDDFVIGVDGGATKTDAVVMTADGRVLGRGRAGCSNWESAGLLGAADAIGVAVSTALEAAGCDRREIAASAFALAGVDWPEDEVRLAKALEPLELGGSSLITNDAFAALRAGISGRAGCVSSAGTGAVAAGRNEDDRTARTMAEGFGELGGAGDIIERALWACARMREASGPSTELAAVLCSALGASDLDDLFQGITRRGLRVGAELAPRVLEVAERGDEVAQRLLEEQGRSLADEVLGVARRLGMLDAPFELVIAGSVHMAGSAPLDDAFTQRVAEGAPGAQILPLRERAVIGAARLALDQIAEAP